MRVWHKRAPQLCCGSNGHSIVCTFHTHHVHCYVRVHVRIHCFFAASFYAYVQRPRWGCPIFCPIIFEGIRKVYNCSLSFDQRAPCSQTNNFYMPTSIFRFFKTTWKITNAAYVLVFFLYSRMILFSACDQNRKCSTLRHEQKKNISSNIIVQFVHHFHVVSNEL